MSRDAGSWLLARGGEWPSVVPAGSWRGVVQWLLRGRRLGSARDIEELAKRRRVRAGFVDGHRACPADAAFDDQTAVGEPVHFTHHGGGVDIERPGELGESEGCPVCEEELHQQSSLSVRSEDREAGMLHEMQYILRGTQNKALRWWFGQNEA
jgi:hypothetical protein